MFVEYLIVFFARILDVSLATIRMILVVRGKRYPAAFIGFFEVSIYVVALGRVVGNMNDPFKILAYGLGFASGTILGSFLEEKLAIGHVSLEVIPEETASCEELLAALRSAGFGVTVLTGRGMRGERPVIMVTTDRKTLPKLTSLVEEFSPGAFIAVLETRSVKGGVIPYRKMK